jgi:CHASE2 domain-containing sensor protein
MTAKSLLVLSGVWFGAVALWLFAARLSIHIGWRGRGKVMQSAGQAVIYALAVAYVLFLVGWVVPAAIGMHRLLRKH